MSLRAARRVHFIGIGGAGMSALAKVLLESGVEVSGSDLKRSRTAAVLQAMGARIAYGHDPANLGDAEVVVASAAVPPANPELAAARAAGLEVLTRGEALAELLASTRAVCVAGTHGKTTTTSMVVSILTRAGADPTYLVGGGLNDAGTNARLGSGELAVAETDESDGSFLLLEPWVAVVTNLEADHLDHWGSPAALEQGFRDFVARTRPGGTAVLPAEEERLAAPSGVAEVRFGEGGDVRAEDVEVRPGGTRFVLVTGHERFRVELAVPGLHNVANALAAAAAASALGVDPPTVARGLEAFQGVERRFQHRGSAGGVTVIDDYAHHPTEVRATLEAARSGPWRRLVAVFQPHRYTRTAALWREFGPCFAPADVVVVTDVYGAGEQPVPGVSGKLVVDAVAGALRGRTVAYLPHRADLVAYLRGVVRPGDAVLTLGAGDITTLAEELLPELGERR